MRCGPQGGHLPHARLATAPLREALIKPYQALTRLSDMEAWLVWLGSRLRTVGTRLSSSERALVLLVPSSTLLVSHPVRVFLGNCILAADVCRPMRRGAWAFQAASPAAPDRWCGRVWACGQRHLCWQLPHRAELDLAVSISSSFVYSRWPLGRCTWRMRAAAGC